MIVHTILYVADQDKSANFYKVVLGLEPQLHVPGMTEFRLSEKHVLGLMPEVGIKRLLAEKIPDPVGGSGIPRAELYIKTDNPNELFERAIQNGARELSPILERNWGDRAGYLMDFDGHILAFAE